MRISDWSSDVCSSDLSAVGHGVGLAGLAGLLLWIVVARHFGMDGPYAGMAGVFACGVPMVLWSMLVDKVHLRPSTGIDWKHPKPFRETLDISLVRSEEHTSELQSLMRISYAVFCLKKKNIPYNSQN